MMPTREEMIAYLSQGQEQPEPESTGPSREEMIKYLETGKEKDSALEDFGEGLAVSGMKTYYGIKDLFGAMDDEDRATLKDWQEDASESGWGTAGQVVGDIGQMAIPGGGALKALKLAGKAKNIGRMGKFGLDAASGALVSGLQIPDEGESRAENVMDSITGAAIGGAGGALLRKSLAGISKSTAAQKLIDEGIELTPGQAASGGIPKLLEYKLERFPGLSGAVKKVKGRGLENFNKAAFEKAALPGTTITKTGKEGFDQLRESYNKAYDDAWADAVRPSNKDMVQMVNYIVNAGETSASKSPYRNILGGMKEMSRDFNQKTIKKLDRIIRDERNANWSGGLSDETLDSNLKELQKMLADAIGGNAKDKLQKINSSYNKLISIRKATGYQKARERGGQFTPQELLRGTKVGGDLEDMAVAGSQTLGRKDPLGMFGSMTRYLAEQGGAIPGAETVLKATGRRMMGEGAEQRYLRALIDSLRGRGIGSGTIGAAIGG